MRHWATRTVCDGRVRIGGKVYSPQQHHRRYDGRLDGRRFLFGLYAKPGGGYEPFVALWGTEEAARSGVLTAGPEVVDGTLPWLFWDEVD